MTSPNWDIFQLFHILVRSFISFFLVKTRETTKQTCTITGPQHDFQLQSCHPRHFLNGRFFHSGYQFCWEKTRRQRRVAWTNEKILKITCYAVVLDKFWSLYAKFIGSIVITSLCLGCMLNTMKHKPIDRQRLGKHILEVMLSTIEGDPSLGNRLTNTNSWQQKMVFSVGSLPGNYKRVQSGELRECKTVWRSTTD
jgi:hypothetical protein